MHASKYSASSNTNVSIYRLGTKTLTRQWNDCMEVLSIKMPFSTPLFLAVSVHKIIRRMINRKYIPKKSYDEPISTNTTICFHIALKDFV